MFESGLSETVGPSEKLARFVFRKKMFYASSGKPKPSTLYPNPKNNETSVSRVDSLGFEEIVALGNQCQRLRPDDPPLHGFVNFLNQSVLDQTLNTIADDTPPRHANIVGWEAFEASKQKALAQNIAKQATYHSI